jgi:hypothetical protein
MKGSELKRRRAERERPAPIVGIEAAHDRMSDALARRDDRFSQLLARAVRDERHGAVLMTTSGLTSDEHEELAHLTPAAHENFGAELAATIARLRDLLTAGDPFFILAVVQDLNLLVPWGEYYEPTHEGLETRLELVAGLLAMQPVAVTPDRPAAETVQAILDEIGYRNYLRVHAHDDAAFFYPLGRAGRTPVTLSSWPGTRRGSPCAARRSPSQGGTSSDASASSRRNPTGCEHSRFAGTSPPLSATSCSRRPTSGGPMSPPISQRSSCSTTGTTRTP